MIQRDQLESRYAGRAAFVERLLGVFVHTYAAVPGELRQAVESGDSVGVARLAHLIKGSAGNISAPELRQQAAVTEAAARDGAADTGHHATHLAELLRRCLGEIGS